MRRQRRQDATNLSSSFQTVTTCLLYTSEYTYTEDDTYLSVYGGEYGGLAFVILISAATEDELFDGMLLDVTNTIRPVK